MLKKYLSALIALILIITSVTSISLVTAYATGDTATEDVITTTVQDTGYAVTTTEFNTAMDPCVRDISRAELEHLARPSSFGYDYVDGAIFDTAEFDKALAYAEEVLANLNATQEEINTAYYTLLSARDNIKQIGYTAAPFLSGDYDHDDDVTIKDATSVQMVVARLYGFNQSDGYTGNCYIDVNFDFKINIKDVAMIQCFVAGFTDRDSCGGAGQRLSPSYYFNNQYSLD